MMGFTVPRCNIRGFSLLELLVALAIAAFTLPLIYRTLGSSARQVADVQKQLDAVAVAGSLLTLDSVAGEGWNSAGSQNGFEWEVRSARYDTGVDGPDVTPLYQIWVSVKWLERGRQRSFGLTTLRPERKPLPASGPQ